MPFDIVPSVCPHDCPSACALEVERIDGRRIGRVRGAAAQAYTLGVVCTKVARGALCSNLGLVALDLTLIEGLDRLDPGTRILDQARIGPVLLATGAISGTVRRSRRYLSRTPTRWSWRRYRGSYVAASRAPTSSSAFTSNS